MQALPYLQLRESESPTSSAKINYRLSRHETAAKTACHDDGQTRDGKSVNRPVSVRQTAQELMAIKLNNLFNSAIRVDLR